MLASIFVGPRVPWWRSLPFVGVGFRDVVGVWSDASGSRFALPRHIPPLDWRGIGVAPLAVTVWMRHLHGSPGYAARENP